MQLYVKFKYLKDNCIIKSNNLSIRIIKNVGKFQT